MSDPQITYPYSPGAITHAALKYVHRYGKSDASTWLRPPDYASIGTNDIVYQVPDALKKLNCYQFLVWKDKKLVLSLTWEQDAFGAYKTAKLHPGAWVDELLMAADVIV